MESVISEADRMPVSEKGYSPRLPFTIVSIKPGSIRVTSCGVSIDLRIVDSDGDLQVKVPEHVFFQPSVFRRIVGMVLNEYRAYVLRTKVLEESGNKCVNFCNK